MVMTGVGVVSVVNEVVVGAVFWVDVEGILDVLVVVGLVVVLVVVVGIAVVLVVVGFGVTVVVLIVT